MVAGRPAIAGVVCYYEVNGRLAFEYGFATLDGWENRLSVRRVVRQSYVRTHGRGAHAMRGNNKGEEGRRRRGRCWLVAVH